MKKKLLRIAAGLGIGSLVLLGAILLLVRTHLVRVVPAAEFATWKAVPHTGGWLRYDPNWH